MTSNKAMACPKKDELATVFHLFENANIFSWVSHGTLLGLIRDGEIIPWDTDLDLSVWKDEVSSDNVRELMLANGYKEDLILGDMDCLHFRRVEKSDIMVDISFYRREYGNATVYWHTPPSAFLRKLSYRALSLAGRRDTSGEMHIKQMLKKVIYFLATPLRILKAKGEPLITTLAMRMVSRKGYSYSQELLSEFEWLDVTNAKKLRIPKDYEEYLAQTYGDDWSTPNRDFIWYRDAKNIASEESKGR